jgi:acyl-[acyl-carrier-protein]-phospholipid O-acyltransferase/long-chain-fatty-acid--[acyl-carrier-protein] ligase
MSSPTPAHPKHLTVLHPERLPSGGGFLLLPTQLSRHDLPRLTTLLGDRPITFLIENDRPLPPGVLEHLEAAHASVIAFIPSSENLAAFRSTLQQLVSENRVIVHLPAAAATLNAPVTVTPGGTLDFLLSAAIPALPFCVHHAGDVHLSIEARSPEDESTFAFAPLLAPADATVPNVLQHSFLLAAETFSSHPSLNLSLPYALIQGFKKHGSRARIIDGKDPADEKTLGFDKAFAAAIALSRHIKSETQKDRVAIVLPPGLGGLIANVAVLLAGKTPVNLNFTAAHNAVVSAIKQSGVDRFITADIFVRKMQAFPWPASRNMILIERVLPTLKAQITKWFLLSKLLPASLIATLLGVPKKGGDREALLLFTSGSSGDPKGVVLTHRNVIANVAQFSSRLDLNAKDSVLGCLPLFHSFGCTVTLWYPIIEGIQLVTYPSPLDPKRLAELIEKYRVTLLVATPTFLRGYLRGVHREQLGSLKLVVTGAEKLPASVAAAFEDKFGKTVLEGYGLTETSPVTNVNLPPPPPLPTPGALQLPGHRAGSVGQLMPGLAIRITDPESNTPRPIDQQGMIWFKGPNIFPGYLDDPKRTACVLSDDAWFRTGDIGRVDADGFLYIEGRLSRFSKIGGEMIPHETVEELLNKALGLENEDARRIAVVGIPDADRGEALILLSAIPGGSEHQEIIDLRYRLLEQGVPALWIPKTLKRVHEIPVLASGKLDVQGCITLAQS